MFSGTCNVSGDCITSPNYPSTYDSPSLCVMWSPAGALFVQDFVTQKAFDVLYVDGVSYMGFYGPWDVDLPDGSPLFWVADSSVAELGWRICLASDSSSSTSSSSSSTSTSGYNNSTSDESPESVSSSSTSDESPESVSGSGGAFCGGVIVASFMSSARCSLLPQLGCRCGPDTELPWPHQFSLVLSYFSVVYRDYVTRTCRTEWSTLGPSKSHVEKNSYARLRTHHAHF